MPHQLAVGVDAFSQSPRSLLARFEEWACTQPWFERSLIKGLEATMPVGFRSTPECALTIDVRPPHRPVESLFGWIRGVYSTTMRWFPPSDHVYFNDSSADCNPLVTWAEVNLVGQIGGDPSSVDNCPAYGVLAAAALYPKWVLGLGHHEARTGYPQVWLPGLRTKTDSESAPGVLPRMAYLDRHGSIMVVNLAWAEGMRGYAVPTLRRL